MADFRWFMDIGGNASYAVKRADGMWEAHVSPVVATGTSRPVSERMIADEAIEAKTGSGGAVRPTLDGGNADA